ncbi:MAG: radical SAM protein [Candidatus Njordarchaeales archaeon]
MDYSINPYFGCEHACTYCYARFLLKVRGEDPTRWGSFVHIKINGVSVLKKEIYRAKRGKILFSSVTDPYQPIESKYKLTRKLLEIVLRRQFPVVILTKSNLVLRDIDIFRKFNDIEIGLTVTTISEQISKIFEPHAPSPMMRINALSKLSKEFDTYLFLGPIMPVISESEIEEIVETAYNSGVKRIIADRLNMKGGNYLTIREALKNFPLDEVKNFWYSLWDPSYYRKVKVLLHNLGNRFGIPIDFCW